MLGGLRIGAAGMPELDGATLADDDVAHPGQQRRRDQHDPGAERKRDGEREPWYGPCGWHGLASHAGSVSGTVAATLRCFNWCPSAKQATVGAGSRRSGLVLPKSAREMANR